MFALIVRQFARRRRDPLVGGFLAMYLGYLAAAVFSNAIWDRWLWFPIACGLAAAAHSRERNSPSGATQSSSPVT